MLIRMKDYSTRLFDDTAKPWGHHVLLLIMRNPAAIPTVGNRNYIRSCGATNIFGTYKGYKKVA